MGLSCGTWRQEVKILRDQSQELGTFETEAVMYVSPGILTLLLSATTLTFSASTNQLHEVISSMHTPETENLRSNRLIVSMKQMLPGPGSSSLSNQMRPKDSLKHCEHAASRGAGRDLRARRHPERCLLHLFCLPGPGKNERKPQLMQREVLCSSSLAT